MKSVIRRRAASRPPKYPTARFLEVEKLYFLVQPDAEERVYAAGELMDHLFCTLCPVNCKIALAWILLKRLAASRLGVMDAGAGATGPVAHSFGEIASLL